MIKWHKAQVAAAALGVVLVVGTIGYLLLGFDLLEAVYQTVTTVTTVGYREVKPLDSTGQIFTIVLILAGVGTALYTLGVLLEALVEGQLQDLVGKRKMTRDIQSFQGHTIVCGWGRVGRTIAQYTVGVGQTVVVIDDDAERLEECPHPYVIGDATSDDVLRAAGIDNARSLVAAVSGDADNLFIVVSARALRRELFIVARVRADGNESKMLAAGADRVSNPQMIGGARMAALVAQPHVAEFLDVVMHDGSLEFRLAEIPITTRTPIAGKSLRDAHIRDQTGALVLAIRRAEGEHGGEFMTNPPPETELHPGQVLIAVGTQAQLDALGELAGSNS